MKQTSSLALLLLTLSCMLGFPDRVIADITPTNAPPVITSNPLSLSVIDGDFVFFRVAATGTPPLTYQWFFDDKPITNATSAVYAIGSAQLEQAGSYSAIVSNSFGSVTSLVAALVVDGVNAFGVAGAPFAYQIAANINPTGFSASGLPRGLFCDVGSGVISGTPTATGFFPVRVTARSIFTSVSTTIVFYIGQGKITSAGTAEGIVGVPFVYEITADNSPTRFSASALPSGLHFDATFGIISGTPSKSGSFPVAVQAKSNYGTASNTIVIKVNEGDITSARNVPAIVATPFSYQITADNDPIQFSASSLPPGLHFNATFGLISGTPTHSGSFPVNVTARNFYGSALATIVINVNDGSITGGTAATPQLTISRTGGNVLLSWPAASGDFVLEETYLQQSTWSNSPVPVIAQANQNVASVPIQSAVKFYRLRRP